MSTLSCIETTKKDAETNYGCFVFEPLDTGHGITLGNALRRTLLSDLTGFAIVGLRINNLNNEFTTIPGLREDVLELIFNLKEIIFKTNYCQNVTENNKYLKLTGFFHAKGPQILTAGMFLLPKDIIQIVNPNQYIGTIVQDIDLYFEIDIENGKGYKLIEETRSKNRIENSSLLSSTLLVDGLFMPIKRVNYKIKIINDTKGNLKESLLLEIWTNGSISPKRSIQEAIKVLMNLFYPLFLSTQFRSLSSTITSTNEDEKIVSKTIFLSPLEKKKFFKMNGTKNNK